MLRNRSFFFIVISLFCLSGLLSAQPTFTTDAHFVYSDQHLDSLVSEVQKFPFDHIFMIIYVKIPLRFVVTAQGDITDITVHDRPGFHWKENYRDTPYFELEAYFTKQAKEICQRTSGLWIPATRFGGNVADTLEHTFTFRSNFKEVDVEHSLLYGGTKDFVEVELNGDGVYRFDEDYGYLVSGWPLWEPYPEIISEDTLRQIQSIEYAKRMYDYAIRHVEQNELLIAEMLIDDAYQVLDDNKDVCYDRGVIKLKLNKREEACQSFTTGYQLGDQEVKTLIDQFCQ